LPRGGAGQQGTLRNCVRELRVAFGARLLRGAAHRHQRAALSEQRLHGVQPRAPAGHDHARGQGRPLVALENASAFLSRNKTI
jgi:hypothetical protein